MTRRMDYADECFLRSQQHHALRSAMGCGHQPMCESLDVHRELSACETAERDRVRAEHIAKTATVQRLMRFDVERVDPRAVALTTASEMFVVSEGGVFAHFVVVGQDRSACSAPHADGDTSGCPDAILKALMFSLQESLSPEGPE